MKKRFLTGTFCWIMTGGVLYFSSLYFQNQVNYHIYHQDEVSLGELLMCMVAGPLIFPAFVIKFSKYLEICC